jgi:acyl-CoA synthetase (AMP-forming)/AMP-acid ligase II
MSMELSPFASFADVLKRHADERSDAQAYVFLSDDGTEQQVLTFAALERRATTIACFLRKRYRAGERALLFFPPGLDFIVAFFGCLFAGLIAVPMMVPRRQSSRDASAAIVADCEPRVALTNADLLATRSDLVDRFANTGMDLIPIECAEQSASTRDPSLPAVNREDIALLQYTSGSTSDPKGVVVTHDNLLANSEMIRICHRNTACSTYMSWLPFYHDMGLIANALQSLYVGALAVIMAPTSFLRRPLNWLRAIHHYRAEVACAPNFAFDLCASRFQPELMEGIDLSSWRVALNGAEPIAERTIERFTSTFAPYGFDAKAIFPAYGMAEATVLISAGCRGVGPVVLTVQRDALLRGRAISTGSRETSQTVVGCGKAASGTEIAIVDADTRQRRPIRSIGEIWVRGPHVAKGYWGERHEAFAVFGACMDGQTGGDWLRTGDLGFFDDTGELFVTGRIKDAIIIRGINHYPQDIEESVQDSHPALRKHGGAAFGICDQDGLERLIVVQEVERIERNRVDSEKLEGCIREAIVHNHEIAPHRVVLILPGQIPKTTSGKIQRALTRRLWLEGAFKLLR